MSPVRLWITVGVLLVAFALLHGVSHGEATVPHQALRELPLELGNWAGIEKPLSDRILQAVGVTDYLNRSYFSDEDGSVQLYVGYYSSQSSGDTIHSPKNCLPGSGWDPVQSDRASIALSSTHRIVVNEYIVQRGPERQLVFYWYQGRGRVTSSEYSSKFWMVADAISRDRTDGALVRVITPIRRSEGEARERLENFTRLVFPSLDAFIPQ
jgi:EpsI family protein